MYYPINTFLMQIRCRFNEHLVGNKYGWGHMNYNWKPLHWLFMCSSAHRSSKAYFLRLWYDVDSNLSPLRPGATTKLCLTYIKTCIYLALLLDATKLRSNWKECIWITTFMLLLVNNVVQIMHRRVTITISLYKLTIFF